MPVAIIISTISVTFSIFFGIVSLVLNIKNNRRTDNSDLEDRVRENTRINMKLDAISSNTKDIKDEVVEMRKELNSHDNRIIKVEESVKSLHHRIDGMEAQLNENKEV
jgi:predicted nuclease with TOPRIM domain